MVCAQSVSWEIFSLSSLLLVSPLSLYIDLWPYRQTDKSNETAQKETKDHIQVKNKFTLARFPNTNEHTSN
jgi:hypothetical protein